MNVDRIAILKNTATILNKCVHTRAITIITFDYEKMKIGFGMSVWLVVIKYHLRLLVLNELLIVFVVSVFSVQ